MQQIAQQWIGNMSISEISEIQWKWIPIATEQSSYRCCHSFLAKVFF